MMRSGMISSTWVFAGFAALLGSQDGDTDAAPVTPPVGPQAIAALVEEVKLEEGLWEIEGRTSEGRRIEVEINAENVQVIRQRYPAAGRPNARVELFVRDLDAASPGRKLDAAGAGDGYLARVDWFPDSKSLAVQRQSRDQKTLELLRVAIGDGSARSDNTFIENLVDGHVEAARHLLPGSRRGWQYAGRCDDPTFCW